MMTVAGGGGLVGLQANRQFLYIGPLERGSKTKN